MNTDLDHKHCFLLQNSSLQDHLKSKKHMKTVEEKKERYPDIMKMMMAQTRVAPPEETDRPNNGDRLQYRSGWCRTVGDAG